MALGGILAKSFAGFRWPRLSTVLYLTMGWIALIANQPMWQLLPGWGLFWLVAGGLAYTLDVVFFVLGRPPEVRPFCLAPVCGGGHGLPCYGGALLRFLNRLRIDWVEFKFNMQVKF